jgi:tetratricopeptide (TPR) repeat protein
VFGRKAKIRKAVDRALASEPADHAAIDALPADQRPTAYYNLGHTLADDERYADAKRAVERALELEPNELDLYRLAATIHRELGDTAAAIAAQRRVVAATPGDIAQARALGEMLVAAGALDDAIALLRPLADAHDRELDALLAEALFVHGESDEAFAILDAVCKQYELQLREPWSVPDRQGLISRAQHAMRLRDDVYADLHGREATIELAAASGRLDARAGVNYLLLGARLASTSDRVAEVLELQTPDATEQRAGTTALGLALIGTSQLRRGELAGARKSFERASALDGRCFAAFYGLGAVLDHEKYDLRRRAERLPLVAAASADLVAVVPDWPALTDLERRVVWASIGPFAAMLPVLASRAVTMRILPIDVRATDIGLFEHVAGKRAADDHRSYDAIAGVATMRGAIAKIEHVLDTASNHAWTLAHEFAHLVYFHMDAARAAPFEELFRRAQRVGYATTPYALKNDDELFAVSYANFLRQRHASPGAPIADDSGIQDALTSYFRALSA